MKVHEFGSPKDKTPKTRQQVVDKIDEIRKQRGEFNVGLALIGTPGNDILSEKSKLIIKNSLEPECDEIIVSTTFRSGDKESLKTQLHQIVDDLVDAL